MFRCFGDFISSKDAKARRLSLHREPSVWTIEEDSVCYLRKMHLEQLLDVYYKGHVQIEKENVAPLSHYNAIPQSSTIEVSLKTASGELKSLSLFVKLFMEEREDLEKRAAAYLRFDILTKMKKEIQMYDVVISTMEKFQKHFNVSETFLYGNMFATCLGVRMSKDPPQPHLPDHSSAIILEHPEFRNYTGTAIDQRGFDRATTTMILRQMARFHACPIAMRLKKGATFRETILPILYLDVKDYEPVPSDETLLQELISDRLKDRPLLQSHLPGIKNSQQLSRLFDWIYLDAEDQTWYTICHTKYGIPNILTSKGDGDAPGPSKLLEMSKFTYNSCCTDLAYFMYTSVQADILGKCLDEMLKEYFDEFKITLDKHQLASEFASIYSFKRFKLEFRTVEKRILTNLMDAIKSSSCKGYTTSGEPIFDQDYIDRITYVFAAYSR